MDATKTSIKEEMLWPQRMLIPAEKNVAKGEKPGFVLTDAQLKKVLLDPLLLAEQLLKSLQTIASGAIGQKREPCGGSRPGTRTTRRARRSTSSSRTRPTRGSSPRNPPRSSRRGRGCPAPRQVTAVKTVDLSLKTVEVTKQVATSDGDQDCGQERRDVLARRDLGGWAYNVAARAQGKVQTDARGYPKADAWTEGAQAKQGRRRHLRSPRVVAVADRTP